MKIEHINESFSYVEFEEANDTVYKIMDKLSFFLPGYQFMPGYRAGVSDGKKKFFKIKGNTIVFPRGLSYKLYESMKGELEIVVDPPRNITDEEINDFINYLNLPFQPYDFQLKCIKDCLRNKRQVNQLATGSGKSIIQYVIARWFIEKENKKVLLIVPRIMLVNQMQSDFIEYGWKNTMDIQLVGDGKKLDKIEANLIISTWQSLYKNSQALGEIDVLIGDECHGIKSEVWEDIIIPSCKNAEFRYGFTGTLPKELIHKMSILGSIGYDKKYITPRNLIDRGLATPVEINAMYLEYSDENRKIIKNLSYIEETAFFIEHVRRNDIITKLVNKLKNQDSNTIVLFNQVEHGKYLAKNLVKYAYNIDADEKDLKSAHNDWGVYLISGSTSAKEREKIRKLMEDECGNVVFGTTSILSTGINIKNLNNLVLASGGKSDIIINQSIGRLLRLHVKKSLVKIWDIVDVATTKRKNSIKKNYFYKHFEERLEIYNEHEYDIIERTIKL